MQWTQYSSARRRAGAALLTAEMPGYDELAESLAHTQRLVLSLALPLSPAIPVAHASHTGPQALLGVVAKHQYGAALVVWDQGAWAAAHCAAAWTRGTALTTRLPALLLLVQRRPGPSACCR